MQWPSEVKGAVALGELTPLALSSSLLSWKTSHLGECHRRGIRLWQCLLAPLGLKIENKTMISKVSSKVESIKTHVNVLPLQEVTNPSLDTERVHMLMVQPHWFMINLCRGIKPTKIPGTQVLWLKTWSSHTSELSLVPTSIQCAFLLVNEPQNGT